jgi:hypothetical protein
MINGVVAWLPRGLVAVVIVIVAAAIARVVRDVVGSALSSLSYGRTLATIASVFILGLGVIAALGQAGIATTITGPVLIAVLGTIAGILVVGVGGGLVQPMRQRWERMLETAEHDARGAASGISTYQQGRTDAMTGQPATSPTTTGSMTGQGGSGMSGSGQQGMMPGSAGRPDPRDTPMGG